MDELGTLLRQLLGERGLEQQEFADLVNLSESQISRVIHGTRWARWEDWRKWSIALRLDAAMGERLRLAMAATTTPEPMLRYIASLEGQLAEVRSRHPHR